MYPRRSAERERERERERGKARRRVGGDGRVTKEEESNISAASLGPIIFGFVFGSGEKVGRKKREVSRTRRKDGVVRGGGRYGVGWWTRAPRSGRRRRRRWIGDGG